MNDTKARVMFKDANADRATLIAVLLASGIWNQITIEDREAFCERGEIRDTDSGRLIHARFAPSLGPWPEAKGTI